MAKAAGVSHRSVQRIWAAHGQKPHRVKTFKLSNDPKFAARAALTMGLDLLARLTRTAGIGATSPVACITAKGNEL
jgi:hypothetical protein